VPQKLAAQKSWAKLAGPFNIKTTQASQRKASKNRRGKKKGKIN
jgi:hypothetical protein